MEHGPHPLDAAPRSARTTKGRSDMTEQEIAYLETVVERSKERRNTFFGEVKTSKAEAAEMVLVAFAPALIAEVKRLTPPRPN